MLKYDGHNRHNSDTADQRERIYSRDEGRCQHCGRLVPMNAWQLAHRIMDAKWTRSKYGDDVIDSDANKCVTCPTDRCNSGVLVSFDPAECDRIVKEARNAII